MTKAIKPNEARLPFLSDKITFIGGLDPLGVQTPSTQTYSNLLPGLNNVTNRIRYYSFYCWLLGEYGKQVKLSDPALQKKFIRKAEYIIALIAAKFGIPGISGNLYAGKRVDENPEFFDLEKGTYNQDGSTFKTYWLNSFGILGQYYIGSLKQIGLLEEPMDSDGKPLQIFRRTDKQEKLKVSGEELALAFENNIHKENINLFLDCINKSKVNHDELEKLSTDFNLTIIPDKSDECHLLIELLLDKDESQYQKETSKAMRRETIFHLLNFSDSQEQTISPREFTMFAYDNKGFIAGRYDECLFGWYHYQFNDYWQVACTGILNGLLDFLSSKKGPNWILINDFIQISTEAVINLISKHGLNANLLVDSIPYDIFSDEKDLYLKLMGSIEEERMLYGFFLIWKLYSENYQFLVKLKRYTIANSIGGTYDGISFFQKYDIQQSKSIKEFIEDFLFSKIIIRHQYVAYRKMGGGNQTTEKFIIEKNHIRFIDNFNPTFTSPRLDNLLSFLKDLGIMDQTYKSTKKAKNQVLKGERVWV